MSMARGEFSSISSCVSYVFLCTNLICVSNCECNMRSSHSPKARLILGVRVFWEIRVSWLSVRTQWGPSKHHHGQMSLLVCLDSETRLRQMHKPLKTYFFLSKAKCQKKESNWKHWSLISNCNVCPLHTATHEGHAYIVASMLLLLWQLLFQHTVVSAWFHFTSLPHPALSQPPCKVHVGKLLKPALGVGAATSLFTFSCSAN